jgi:ABC-type cobalt transport system substrate-binding protein
MDLRNVIQFGPDSRPNVDFVVVPLLLLDYAIAMMRRDYGLADDQARAESDEIEQMIREDWPKVFPAAGEVEYRTYSIEVAAGEVKFDVVGQALDYIQAWVKRGRASA